MTWTMDPPQPGDILRVRLKNGLWHYGVYASDEEVIQFGLPPVNGLVGEAESVAVLSTDVDAFRCGGFPEASRLTPAERRKARSPRETVDYARSKLGMGGYDLLTYNCEHFANECLFGVRSSSQVDAVRAEWRRRLKLDEPS